MSEKELEIPGKWRREEWKTNKIRIRKWNLGIRNDIMSGCSKLKIVPDTVRQSPDFDWAKYQILSILHCVIEAPWTPGSLEFVRGLDANMSDWIFKEVQALNEGDIKNSEGSEESSEEKPKEPDQSKEQSNSTN